MADSYSVKKITELTENTTSHDTDLFVLGNEGTATMRKVSFSNLATWVKTKLGALVTTDVINNATSTATDKPVSAAVAKDLQGQIGTVPSGSTLQGQINTLNSKFVTVVYNGNLGALNAGASGYITASVNVPSGYITRGIASVAKQHIAGAPSLTIMPNVASNQSGTFTFYPSYYTAGAVANGQADFSIYILCSKD